MNSTIDHFKNAMLDAGITPPDAIIGDGVLHRFKIDGKLNGAYVLHLDGRAAGYFEDFKQGIKQRWKMAGPHKPLTDAERQAFKAERIKQELELKTEVAAKHANAAKQAMAVWNNSDPATDHPYLVKKQIKPHLSRLYKGSLIIPLYSASRELVNLQFIQGDGSKRFLTGGQKAARFCTIGEGEIEKNRTVLIAEGFATAATLNEATGHITVVAFDAGNLRAVATAIKIIAPEAVIIICADNDSNGVGEHKAREAALAINCKYIIPPTLGDFNDHLAGSVNHGG